MRNNRDLSTFLLRIVISGAASGFLVGLLLFYKAGLVLDIMASMIRNMGVNLTGSELENTLNIIKTTIKFYPIIQPVNTAITLAIIGIISWFIARVSESRYRTAMVITITLYGVLMLASTAYMAKTINNSTPIYLIGLPSIASFTIILLVLEWKNIPSTEPAIT